MSYGLNVAYQVFELQAAGLIRQSRKAGIQDFQIFLTLLSRVKANWM
jgi:hypothetical protein